MQQCAVNITLIAPNPRFLCPVTLTLCNVQLTHSQVWAAGLVKHKLFHTPKTTEGLHASQPDMTISWGFPSCSESTEIWHADSFSVKKHLCIFFHKQGNKASNTFLKVHSPLPSRNPHTPPPPPPPPPSNSIKDTHSVFALKDRNPGTLFGDGQREREWEGVGWTFTQFCPYFSAFLKKTQGTFFNTKRVDMPNFSRF